uniref:Uncharacterized protein n=1 Tax=Arundo donax TaxID=35708 RepID=A0A0A9C938_ARUDO
MMVFFLPQVSKINSEKLPSKLVLNRLFYITLY